MATQIINAADVNAYAAQVEAVARALREGALVIFPTETVYGVGANAANPEAIRRLREIKQSPDRRPFTVHLGRKSDARLYVRDPSPVFRRFARKAWPGPLTLVVIEPEPMQTEIAQRIPPGQLPEIFHEGAVGLRVPDHPVAARLLSAAGVPVVASSANLPQRPPPADVEHALRELEGRVDYALDGRRTQFSAASTVVEVQGDRWRVQREGAIDERTLRRLARSLVLFVCSGNSCRSPMAEYMFRQKLAERLGRRAEELRAAGYEVMSAGVSALPGARASAGTLGELASRGIAAEAHVSQPLTVELIQQADRVYVMTPEHRAAVLALVPSVAERVELLDPSGPVTDPIGGGAADYRACADHIERALLVRLEEYLDEDRHW